VNLRRALLSVAYAGYRATPSQTVRRLAFNAFARSVRNRRTVATVGGVRYDLDLGELIDLNVFLEQFEPDITAAIRRFTRPGATVLDIGANVGAHTFLFAKLAGPSGRVFAFEPTDYAFAKLKRNLALNDLPQIVAYKLALSDRALEPQSVNFRSSWLTGGGRKDGPSTVSFETLDAWSRDHDVDRIDLVKLDVDGNEFPIVKGGLNTIAASKPVMLCEAVGPHFDDETRNPYRILNELGYRFHDMKSGAAITLDDMRARLPRNDPGMTVSMNVLALPEGAVSP